MINSFLFFFVSYFLVVFVALLGVFWKDERFFWLAGINMLSLLLFFVIFIITKKQEKLAKARTEEQKQDKHNYSNQFVKYPYVKHDKKGKKIVGYLLFLSMFLFLFSVLDLTIFHVMSSGVWLFPLMYLLFLFLSGKDLIENKIKIFGITFNFYLFLFVSSLIVGVLICGTLVLDIISLSLLAASLISFFFFFVGYVFVKNQGLRYFFHLIYSKIYFVIILGILVWSVVAVGSSRNVGGSLEKLSANMSSFFESIFYKENDDPLLYTGKGIVVDSGTIVNTGMDVFTGSTGSDILEETGYVVESSSGVNPIFTSQEESLNTNVTTGSVTKDTDAQLKSSIGIKDTDSISMITALRFLMDYNEISLSSKTNIKFKYVSLTNPLYPYWKTAYEKRIIGLASNPSTKITCETYQVFKGMLLGWDLKYTVSNVKKVFWDESQKQGLLNGCVYGTILKGENL